LGRISEAEDLVEKKPNRLFAWLHNFPMVFDAESGQNMLPSFIFYTVYKHYQYPIKANSTSKGISEIGNKFQPWVIGIAFCCGMSLAPQRN